MRGRRLALGLAIGAALLASGAAARLEPTPIALPDHLGGWHDFAAYEGASAVVLMVQGNGCPLVRNALHDLRAVRERFQDEDIVFLLLNANRQDDADSIRAEAQEWGIDLPVLVDGAQEVGRRLALTRTAEVLVLTPAWDVAYRGPVNDRLTYERQRAEAREHYLADALTAVLAGRPPPRAQVDAPGCLINFDPPESAAASAGRAKGSGHHGSH